MTRDDEQAATSAALWQQAAGLLLTGTRRWTGTGKNLVRELERYDLTESTTFGPDLLNGLRSAVNGDPSPLVRVCDRILDLFGGRHFDGHRLRGDDPTV